MCDIPVPVANEETLVRALRECHVNRKGKLKENVFRSPAGLDEVSVMRHTYMSSDACKAKGKEIAAGNPNNAYVGFAAISAASIRSLHSEVTDSRQEFCGHADISHGVVVPEGEPLTPELNLRLRDLKDRAKLLMDPAPADDSWTGEGIEIQTQPTE